MAEGNYGSSDSINGSQIKGKRKWSKSKTLPLSLILSLSHSPRGTSKKMRSIFWDHSLIKYRHRSRWLFDRHQSDESESRPGISFQRREKERGREGEGAREGEKERGKEREKKTWFCWDSWDQTEEFLVKLTSVSEAARSFDELLICNQLIQQHLKKN